MFYDNPSTPNFIAFSLQRATDSIADEVNGTFSIGEVDPDYASVNSSPQIPTFPVANPTRWNVLLDAILIGSETVPVSSTVQGAPGGKAVVLLDSGSSYRYRCHFTTFNKESLLTVMVSQLRSYVYCQ